jgi:hypothetical protein
VKCLKEGPKITIMAVSFHSINLLRKEVSRPGLKRHFPEDKSSSQENPLRATGFLRTVFGT